MDPGQLFCAVLVGLIFTLFVKSLIFPDRQKIGKNSEVRRKSLMTSRKPSSEPSKPVPEMHDVMELRALSIFDLQTFNGQFSKFTDRYWREIFRRQNDSHHPDHINVSRLQTPNIITVLDENLPKGAIQELTITGLVPKPFSSRRCEVMRYLRERLSTSPNVELTFEGNDLRITSVNSINESFNS